MFNSSIRPVVHVYRNSTPQRMTKLYLTVFKLRTQTVAYPPGDRGTCPPDFKPRGQSCKSPPPHFLTHNNAIAGFTSQSLGLPAYVCKTGSSTAIKLAPKMHPKLAILSSKIKNHLGRGHSHLPWPSPRGEGDPCSHPTPRPSAPRSSHSPWFVSLTF